MYKRILVPIDGSDTAARGLAEALALARELKSTIRLLNLTSDFALMVEMSGAFDVEKYRLGLNQFGQRLLANASKLAKEHGVTAETSLHDLRGGRRCRCDRRGSADKPLRPDRHRDPRAPRREPSDDGQRRRERGAQQPGSRSARPRTCDGQLGGTSCAHFTRGARSLG